MGTFSKDEHRGYDDDVESVASLSLGGKTEDSDCCLLDTENWDEDLKDNTNQTDCMKEVVVPSDNERQEKYEENIQQMTRNQTYHEFIRDRRNGRKHVLGMTDDMILDLDYTTLRLNVITRSDWEYHHILEISKSWERVTPKSFSGVIHLFESSLENIVHDQRRKTTEQI